MKRDASQYRRGAHQLRLEVVVARLAPRGRPGLERELWIGAVRQQRGHQPLVAAHDGHVEGGKARGVGVRVRALVQQVLGKLGESAKGRERGGADAPGVGVINFGAGGKQQPRRLEIA